MSQILLRIQKFQTLIFRWNFSTLKFNSRKHSEIPPNIYFHNNSTRFKSFHVSHDSPHLSLLLRQNKRRRWRTFQMKCPRIPSHLIRFKEATANHHAQLNLDALDRGSCSYRLNRFIVHSKVLTRDPV